MRKGIKQDDTSVAAKCIEPDEKVIRDEEEGKGFRICGGGRSTNGI